MCPGFSFLAYWLFMYSVNTGAMCLIMRVFFGIRKFTRQGIKQELERERERESYFDSLQVGAKLK